MPQRTIETPIGPMRLKSDAGRLATIHVHAPAEADRAGDEALFDETAAQIADYFAGKRDDFDLPLVPAATERGAVLRNAICSIKAGHPLTYGELAHRIASSPRAVGQACARNPLPIVVPCHRIVASDGAGHYSAGHGIVTKSWLLAHESKEKLLWDL
jgi:methylated-DNA-[protein]-cysteine S-methyltransferase